MREQFGVAQPRRPVSRRLSGDLATNDFLSRLLEHVRAHLPEELRGLHSRHQGSLIKFFGADPSIHFELWLHHSRGRVEFGLHFETRDPAHNSCMLEYVADDLLFLKEVLGQGLEAEPWDKGWSRVYISYPIERLGAAEVARLGSGFTTFIETLEPIRREAAEACPA